MINEISPLRLLIAGLVWRVPGSSASGNTFFHAMFDADEQNRVLGRMALVKAGERPSRQNGTGEGGEALGRIDRIERVLIVWRVKKKAVFA
jgi:hypothetical protein